jgi:hypothetical protein
LWELACKRLALDQSQTFRLQAASHKNADGLMYCGSLLASD